MSGDAMRKEASMMDLRRLTDELEGVSAEPFPIEQTELLARFEQLYTGLVSDVLREFVLLNQTLPHTIVPLRPERTVAGIAFTVKSSPTVRITGELEVRTRMLEQLTSDSFIVWDTTKDVHAASWGGVMTATAIGLGVRAACIDGGIRDSNQILQTPLPVFYRYRSPNGALGRCQITNYQIPVLIGEVLVRPGDVVLGDADGVVVVPRVKAMAVLQRAEHLKLNEDKIFSWVSAGESVSEITRRGGYF